MTWPERSKTERGSERPDMALSAGAHTIFLLKKEDMGTSLCCVLVRCLAKETKMFFTFYGIVSTI
jgi:hypothetical protein